MLSAGGGLVAAAAAMTGYNLFGGFSAINRNGYGVATILNISMSSTGNIGYGVWLKSAYSYCNSILMAQMSMQCNIHCL